MSSSAEQDAIGQLAKWSDTKPAPKIRAMFMGNGIVLVTFGFLTWNAEAGRIILMDEARGNVLLTLSIAAVQSMKRLETLLDAPEEYQFSMDFFVAVSLKLAIGSLDLFEIAG